MHDVEPRHKFTLISNQHGYVINEENVKTIIAMNRIAFHGSIIFGVLAFITSGFLLFSDGLSVQDYSWLIFIPLQIFMHLCCATVYLNLILPLTVKYFSECCGSMLFNAIICFCVPFVFSFAIYNGIAEPWLNVLASCLTLVVVYFYRIITLRKHGFDASLITRGKVGNDDD